MPFKRRYIQEIVFRWYTLIVIIIPSSIPQSATPSVKKKVEDVVEWEVLGTDIVGWKEGLIGNEGNTYLYWR